MDESQRQKLIAIINNAHSAAQTLSNQVQTTNDPRQIAACQDAMITLLNTARAANLAIQAANDGLFQQETAALQASTKELNQEADRLKAALTAGGVIQQVVSSILSIIALAATL